MEPVQERRSSAAPYAIAIATGIALWLVSSLLSGRKEPWDGGFYWIFTYPVALLASAFMGYRYLERPWRWPLVIFESQLLGAWIRSGEPGNLWPIAMVMFAALAVPGIVAAHFAARVARRHSGEEF
jgi:hypothetical protein